MGHNNNLIYVFFNYFNIHFNAVICVEYKTIMDILLKK